jgi:hypothetical protein
MLAAKNSRKRIEARSPAAVTSAGPSHVIVARPICDSGGN